MGMHIAHTYDPPVGEAAHKMESKVIRAIRVCVCVTLKAKRNELLSVLMCSKLLVSYSKYLIGLISLHIFNFSCLSV